MPARFNCAELPSRVTSAVNRVPAADETRSKPHPLMLEQLMSQLGSAPAQTLMVGDTEYDMEMARNAQAHPVAVSYGVHEWPRLQRHAPLTCLDNITELGDWLAELARRPEALQTNTRT